MSHINDRLDNTVEVFIVYNKKVLLRKHDKYKIWLSVGGHIEKDEDPNQAALREVKEEVGLNIKLYRNSSIPLFQNEDYQELIPPEFINRHRITRTHEHVTFVYFAKSFTDKLILSETEKSEECKWFGLEELSEEKYNIKEHIQYYSKKALETLST